jgi:mono/diheme cytochrome c family protein
LRQPKNHAAGLHSVARICSTLRRKRRASPRHLRHGKISMGMRNFYCSLAFVLLLTACASGGGTSPIEARKLQNPVEPTPKSIASGKVVYDKYCAECHGPTGNGVGAKSTALAEVSEAKPSDLTDEKWDHGSTDGEIFVNIRDGVGVRGAMKGLNGKPGVSDTDMWNIVNYIRTLKHE